MHRFQDILKGGDLRSIGQADAIIPMVQDQHVFDELFACLTHPDRLVVMRSADAVEKITRTRPHFIQKHKTTLLNLCQRATDIELKWHLALLVSRLDMSQEELKHAWEVLANWATNPQAGKIVRVNAIQGLFNLLPQKPDLSQDFNRILSEISKENVASLNARIRKLQGGRRSS